ncbi:MAG: DUF4097 family beta strand repeat protein [Acidobacteria bacterium]|nr:DUF4097 family beta strand repeat protein [Acidobacteriota bacterium]
MEFTHMRHITVSPRTRALIFAALLAPLAACNLQLSTDVEAKDEWTREYPLSEGGTLSITNSNGTIEITGGDVDIVTIKAERIVKAGNEEAAAEQLAIFEIKEDITPDRVAIESVSKGLSFNISRRVNYVVTVPRHAAVALDGSNSSMKVSGINGHLSAKASNGRITATGLMQGAEASASNGVISLTFAEFSDQGITAETTNGAIIINLPSNVNADFSARVVNGAIRHEGLDLRVSEESRRRLDGRLGAGGPMIRLETTNGGITVKGRD